MGKGKKLVRWLGMKFSIVLLSDQTFDQKKKWKFNRFGFISLVSGIVLFIIALTSTLIVVTPLKELIPGYPDKETRLASAGNAARLDSLEHEIEIRDQYLQNMKDVLLGKVPFNPQLEISEHINDSTPTRELSEDITNENSITTPEQNKPKVVVPETPATLVFFPPAQGVVTNSFDPVRNHFGTDIVTRDKEIVRATLDGTVIAANWTMETGYTMQIQHKYNYISIYRHLKNMLVTTGDIVTAGQSIGTYGNTGEISFGPHLHFELWNNGKALNPENYIDFE
jgi:murein DD-endopeptidase MepM/ murein hydrolase activator NlpD